jgi:1,4-dihydroxy-2-naphthoyl-CoA synthase
MPTLSGRGPARWSDMNAQIRARAVAQNAPDGARHGYSLGTGKLTIAECPDHVRAVPHESLLTEAVNLGKKIAGKGPVAVRLAKTSVTRAFEGRVDDGIELERDLFFLLFSTHDAHEGMHAFIEKRQPTFEGA